jgi:hypothetical protein
MAIAKSESVGSNPLPNSRRTTRQRITLALGVLIKFCLGQGALQSINLLTGLYLVHALSIESYAQFGLAFGFQTTMATLMDLGFAGSIIPLVGDRISDTVLVGRYVRAAKHLRDRTFFIFSPLAAIILVALMHEHKWNPYLQGALLLSVLLALYSGGSVSYFSAPLILYGRLRQYYFPQSLSALGRLLCCLVLGAGGLLSSWVAAALSAAFVSLSSWLLGKEALKLIVWTKSHDAIASKEIRRYILPVIPAVIFSAFQMQIALILISIFGQTVNIAQVAALGRLSQLFAMLTTFNLVVIEPRIARLSPDRLFSAYIRLVAAACLFAAIMIAIGFRFPHVYLWVLGKKYETLGSLTGWVVVTACVGYVTNLIWLMNRSRRWLFWRGTILEIGLTLLVDIVYVSFIGVRTTRGAVFFSLASSICSLCTHLYITTYGFKSGPRVTLQSTY